MSISQCSLHIAQRVRRGVRGRDAALSQPLISRQTHIIHDRGREEIDKVLWPLSFPFQQKSAGFVLDAGRMQCRSKVNQMCCNMLHAC